MNKAIIFSTLKASSDQTLGQNILLVATPWVKPPVNNLEGIRIGLKSLTFGQGGTNLYLWAPTGTEAAWMTPTHIP